MHFENPRTPEEIIIKATSEHFGLSVQHFTERKKTDFKSSYQRQVCIYFIKENTISSFKEAGSFFGMSESGAKNSFYRIRDLITVDRRTKVDCKEIQLLINRFTEKKLQQCL